MRYQPPYQKPSNPNPDAPYINGDPDAGIKGSIIPAEAIEFTQREVVHTIQKGGYVPADPAAIPPLPDDPNLFQLTHGVRRALYAWGIDTGSTNSLSVALDPPLLAYAQGLEIRVMVAADNTAACTIRVNGLSTQQIVKKDGSTLIAGDIRAGGIAVLVHDGANFQLVSGAAGSTTITDGWFSGADYIVDNGTPNIMSGVPAIAPTALAAGQSFLVLVNNANISTLTDGVHNDGATTLNVNSLGAKAVVLPSGLPLVAGDIVKNMLIRVSYDGSQFFMLSPINMALIDQPTTFIVGPNTGADFTDLNIAMRWLSRRRIDTNGSVTFTLQGQTGTALVHNYLIPIVISHPDGERLIIQGAGMNAIPVVGNFVHSGGVGGRVGDAATNVAMLRTKFQTEIRFASGSANRLTIHGRLGKLANLLVCGQSMSSGVGGGIGINGYTTFDTVASCYSGSSCWGIGPNATLTGTNFYSIGSAVMSVALAHSSNLLHGPGTFVIAQSSNDGIQAAHGAIMQIQGTGQPRIYSCGNYGINHWGASSLHLTSAFIEYCNVGGVSTLSANAWCYSTTVSACAKGFIVGQGGSMDCSNGNTQSISSGDYYAHNGGFMYAAGFVNPGAQFSPARNTWGNSDGYIAG